MIAYKRLEPTDHVITPFETNKQWTFDEQSEDINIIDGVFYKGVFNPSEPQNDNGLYERTVWHFINQLYYDFSEDPYTAFGPTEKRDLRQLHGDVKVISFNQQEIGEGIKSGSFRLVHHPGQSDEITIVDDGYGNLVDASINTGSAPNDDNLIAFWNFNEGYKNYKQAPVIYNQQTYSITNFSEYKEPKLAIDRVGTRDFGITGSQWIDSVFETGLEFPQGNGAEGNFSGSLRLTDAFTLNYWSHTTGSGAIIGLKDDNNGNHIIQKSGSVEIVWDNGNRNVLLYTGSYASESVMTTITAKRQGPDSNLYDINLYENGSLVDSGSQNFYTSFKFNNIGFANTSGSQFTGSMDEFRVYNYALTGSEVEFLYDNPSNQKTVGNVFYGHGIATLTNRATKYDPVVSGSETFALTYNSIHTIYEHEFHCTINPGDFNMTMNPTSRTGSDDGGPKLKSHLTGSNWDPYITSVGLYDDLGRLIIVGKLARPIKNDDELPKTIVLRTDF